MIRKRGNPNWGKSFRPGPVLATEFELQVRQLQLTAEMYTSSPELRAWCCVQLGQLYFSSGDWENADKRYQAALAALPEYWSALDHLAELRAAQQKYEDAFALYEKVIARVARPGGRARTSVQRRGQSDN